MPAIKLQAILPRLDGIAKDVVKLKKMQQISLEDFEKDEDKFGLAQHYLRQALEGVFHIGSHILSRLPGGRATEYKEIARKLGDHGIMPRDFANITLTEMGGYRNRLTHFYAEITPQEIVEIIQNGLGDFEKFSGYIKEILKNPQKFNVTVE